MRILRALIRESIASLHDSPPGHSVVAGVNDCGFRYRPRLSQSYGGATTRRAQHNEQTNGVLLSAGQPLKLG